MSFTIPSISTAVVMLLVFAAYIVGAIHAIRMVSGANVSVRERDRVMGSMSDEMATMQEEEAATDTPLTSAACLTARDVLKWAEGVDAPQPTLCPDGEGGLRVEWFSGERRNVRVVIHVTGTGYLYHRGMGRSGITPLSEGNVQGWLRELATNGR